MNRLPVYLLILMLLSACLKEEDGEIAIRDVTETEFTAAIDGKGNHNSPLTAIITTVANEEHTLEVIIQGKYDNNLSYQHKILSRSHTLPLIGLYPAYNNTVFIKAFDSSHRQIGTKRFEIQTDSLEFSVPEIEILHYDQEHLNGRLTFVEYRTGINNIPFVFDEFGDVRWYLKYPDQSLIRPSMVKNSMDFFCGDYGYNVMYKFDWLGFGDTLTLPAGFKMMHHDVYRLNDHIFFPVDEHYILECDQYGNKIKAWNLNEIVKRYLPDSQSLVHEGKDWLHINSVFYEAADQSLVISARQSLGVFKMDYHSGNIQWILNDNCLSWYAYPKLRELALQALEGCELPLGQHSALPLPGNQLLMLDNGYDGYERLGNENGLQRGGKGYSRLVVYEISEEDKTVRQSFEYGRDMKEMMFSRFAGNTGFEDETDTFSGLFGNIITAKNNPVMGRVVEVDRNGNLLFDARLTALKPGELFYRGEKINLNKVISASYD